jgi:hypothetical protein
MLYGLLFGKNPFPASKQLDFESDEQFAKRRAAALLTTPKVGFPDSPVTRESPELRHVLEGMLAYDGKDRPSLLEVRKGLMYGLHELTGSYSMTPTTKTAVPTESYAELEVPTLPPRRMGI